jgi:hypothetical protein
MKMTPEEMRAAIIADLPANTGHDLSYWVDLIRAQGLETREERVLWLKEKQGLGQWQAHTIVYESEKPRGEDHTPSGQK